jgi:predicted nucleic acid-binding protein
MRLLLDTSVLIDALRLRRGRRELLAELVLAGHTLSTTALNIAEVYAGMRPNEAEKTHAFLDALDCYDLTATSAQRAGTLKQEWARNGRTLALADMIVAAIALDQGCSLMTDNGKDFPMEELSRFDLPQGPNVR